MEKEEMLEKGRFKISRRGRPLKKPKKLMTTSSDETKPRKQSKGQTMQMEIDRLRLLVKETGTQDARKAFSEKISPNQRSDVGTLKATELL